MKTTKYILTIALALTWAFNTVLAVNKAYYTSVDGKQDSQLREALTALVYSKHTTNVGYTWDFNNIDIVGGEVLDMYSTCVWTSSQQGKNYTGICDGYNREHVVPQNLFSESLPQKGDRHHLFLTDGKVNGMRSSYPFGETDVTTGFSGISNSEKALGKLGTSTGNFTGTVYEPDDEYKGDIARAIMYMAIRYATSSVCRVGSGATNTYPVTAWGGQMFSNNLSTNYGLSNAAVAVYMAWHRADQPSAKEIARNNGVEALQGNRNPFIDYPELAEYLWGNKKNTAVVLDNLTPTFDSPCTGKWDTPNVTAVAGNEQITLTWEDVTGASSYTVHIGAGEGYTTECSNPSIGAIIHSGTTNTCVITGLVNGLSYTTSVVAKGGTTCDSDADMDTTVPSDAPSDVTVTFNANDGSDDPATATQTIPYNTATNLTAINTIGFSRTGYTFQGWATSSSGSMEYDDEESVTFLVNTTLYAVWQANKHNVTFTQPDKGGTFTVNSSSSSPVTNVNFGSTVTIVITPTNSHFTVNTVSVSGGSGSVAVSGSGNTRTFTMPDEDVTVSVTLTEDAKYTVNWYVNGTPTAETNYAGEALVGIADPSIDCNGKKFQGWTATENYSSDDTAPGDLFTDASTKTMPSNNNTKYYAVFATETTSGGGSSTVDDAITLDDTGVSGTSYSAWTNLSKTSDAVYAGNNAGGNSAIQLRTNNSNSGIVSTTSGGKIKKVVIAWNSNTTTGRIVDVYGSTSAYTAATNLYATAAQGTLLGSLSYDDDETELTISGDYDYVGLRSHSGALYLNSVTFTWSTGSGSTTTISDYTTSCVAPTEVTVTFHANYEGADPATATQTIPYDTETALTANSFSRTGYTFQGWATSSSGSMEYDDEESVTLTSNIHLYAVWQKNSHDVIFTPAPTGATVTINGQSTSPQSLEYGSTVTIYITPDDAYTIGSVTATGVEVSGSGNTRTFTMPDDDVTVTVIMTPKPTHTIRFFDNGTNISEQSVVDGQSAVKPTDPTPCTSDYTFVGWWTAELSSSNTTAQTWVTDFTVTGAQDYFAVFSKTETSGGGEPTPATLEASYSSHDGWTISGTGGTSYWILKDGASITSPVIADLSTVTSITFNARTYGGGSFNTVNVSTSGSVTVGSATASSTSMVGKTINVSGLTGSGSLVFSSSTTSSANGPGINNIVINYATGGGSSTTYYTTSPECPTPCTNEITITKGDNPANGTFTIDNSGTVCIDEGNATVTVTAEPSEHYHLATVTTTGSVGTVGSISGNTCTITGINASTTINVTFAADPKDVVNWYVAGTPTAEEKYAGETLAGLPEPPTSGDCDGVKVFMGWTADATYFNETTAPTDLFTDPTTKTMPAGGTSYYAVFADETTSGAASGSMTIDFEDVYSTYTDWSFTNMTSQQTNSNVTAKEGSYFGVTAGTQTGSITTVSKIAQPTLITFSVSKQTTNTTSSSWWVQTSSDGSTWEDVGSAQSATSMSRGVWVDVERDLSAASDVYVRVYYEGSTAVRCIDNLVLTYGGGTTYSNYTTSCVTYEVTAVTNNDTWGTVAVDGYKVTAMPAEGYIADGYTITVGTATATQNGNIFTVIPTSDCTIQINFRAATPYTVTFIDNNTSYDQTAYELTPFILPEDGLSSCPDATFLGWVEGTYADHTTGTTTEPTSISPGAEVTITGATTYTAVYGTIVDNVSTEYRQLTSLAEYKDGEYLVVAHYSDNLHYAMSNTTTSDHVDEVNVGNGTTVTSTEEKLIWTITKVGSNYTLYNANANKYLALSASAPLIQDEAHQFSMAYSDGFVFESVTETGSQLVYTTNFKVGTSQTKPIYLYKRMPTIGSYTSHPQCCYEPTEKLVIASDVETLIGSGVAHLTLSGGNGKNVTWSTTGGTLSEQTNTSATLTLPTTGSFVVTAVQENDETNTEHVICGAEVSLTINVKAQWTITYKTIEESVEYIYNTAVVTDGDSYTLPDISEEFTCPENVSFAGWASSNSATAVEFTAGTAQTASADATWYAVWRNGSGVKKETRTKYELISDVSSLNVNDVIVLAYKSVGMSSLDDSHFTTVSGLLAEDGSYITFSGSDVVQEMTLKEGPEDTWYLYLEDQYMTFGNKTISLQASAPSTGLSISISSNAAVISDGTYTLQYNNSSPRFTAYSSSQKKPSIYRKNGTVEVEVSADVDYTTNNTCISGAVIRANTDLWITAAKGQKVKRVYEVKALNFDEASTLTIQSNTDSHFTATLAETAIPTAPGRLETTLTVEYLPTESNTTNSTTITLRAGETTKTLEVNGRSLPDEFLVITKKTVWYALPANMNGGEKQYEGVTVTPDDGTEPTSVAIAPSTIVYSLRSVADSRYANNGACVRLAGNGNKALWGNITADAITIQNNEIIGNTNGANYEWLLNTTDGIHYSISNPNHSDFAAGRVLAFGDKFGQYKAPTIFYLVPAGCNSQPQEVNVSPKRVDATFSWLSNASSMAIDLYTDEEMTVLATSVTATSVPYYMTGLNETTDYWFRLIPDGEDACSVTGSFKTTGPTVDIVEWATDGVVIFVDKDEALNPYVVIEGEVEHGIGTAYNATELFFSKYFEGSGNMKLVAIFNGTPNDISLADYKLYTKNCSTPDNEGELASSTFGSTTEYPISALGTIKSGQEIVFFTRPLTTGTQASLSECSEEFLEAMADKSGADEMPRWIECNNSTLYGGQKFPAMQFNGNDAICLEKNDVLIDVIGSTGDPGKVKNCANRLNDVGWAISVKNIDYSKTSEDPAFDGLYEASSKEPITDTERRVILEGFNINLDDETIDLTTARCILFRDKSVTSGEKAVALNTGAEFATCAPFTYEEVSYPSEWNGRAVCMTTAMQTAAGVSNDSRATCNSYQDLGEFDYNDYYKEWTSIDGKTLDEYTYHEDTKTYDIPIDNLSKYTCLNIRFQLKNDAGEIVTESSVQVPIIVTGGHTTIDEIFNAIVKTDSGDPVPDQSIDRCKICNVVVLSDGVLTKATGSDPNDAVEVGNVKVYPGGQLIVPTGTEYTVNSLAFRRQEDEIATANIQGDLNIKATGKNVFLDMRVDPSEWHYIALPYNCNVADIRFAGDEMKIPILGTDYLLKYYDGEKRAATQAGGCWEMVAPDATLRKGIGYIFGIPGEGKVKREFRFPMSNTIITEEKDPEGKIASGVYAFGGDKSMTEVRANHRGWNLIGDPYLLPYSSDIADPVMTGYIVPDYPEDPEAQWDGHYKFADDARSDLRYIVEPVDNGRSEYIQVPITAYEMKPFTSYFVQIGGLDPEAEQGVQFNLSAVERSASPVRRAPAEYAEEQEDMHPVWCAVTITSPKGEKDETTMLISDQFTDGYDIMDDLVKMRGTYYQYAQITTKPVLASRNNEGEMAFNALPDASAEAGIPLHYFAATQGEYVLAYSDKYGSEEIQAVMLLDKQLNEWHDLMNEPYTFYTNRTDDKNRFVLTIRVDRRKEPQIATDTDAASSANDRPRKILHNDHIYILRGDRIYDITGKEMLNR